MSQRQPKSGSSQRRQPRNGVERSKTVFIPPLARGMFQSAIKLASGFPTHSTTSIDTMRGAFTELLKGFGADVISALVVEMYRRKPSFQEMLLCDPAFRVFAEQGFWRAGKRLVTALQLDYTGRMSAYTVMGALAGEEDRDAILAEMRALMQRAPSWNDEYDAHYWIVSVSQDPVEIEYLNAHATRRFAGVHWLSQNDATVLLGIASLSPGFEGMAKAIYILEEFGPASVLPDAEGHLWAYLMPWDRQRLIQLAEAIRGSRYEAEVRRKAAGARDLTEQSVEE